MVIKSRKTGKTGSRKLYIKYDIEGTEKVKSTGLEDTVKNRKFIKNELFPSLAKNISLGNYVRKNTSISYFAKLYLKSKEHLKTYFEIQNKVDKILQDFGSKDITKIKVSDLRQWVSSFEVTPKTIKSYILAFRGIFDMAIEDELIDINPFTKIKLPKHTKKDISPFSANEVSLVLSTATSKVLNFFGIAFFSGMRSGEIIGLKVQDIDFDNMIINVKRSISKGQITTPKTSSSIRQVPVLNDIVPYLKNQITQAVENESEYLFCTKDGKHLNNANSLNLLRFLKSIGLHKRVHDTRHTFIVNMLNSNQIRTTDLAQIVGHANTQMIMTTYTRFIKGEHLSINRGISLYPNFRGTF